MNLTEERVRAAHSYLAAGLSILALTGKAPNSMFHPHGLLSALEGVPESAEDNALIEKVFTHPTTSGVGILIPGNMLVADIDSEEAAALYMELAGEVPDTPTAKTRNGLHVWFVYPGSSQSVWVGAKVLLFRGPGSYVAAPPSIHPEGGRYEWLNPLVNEESGMLSGVDWMPNGIKERLEFDARTRAIEKADRPPTTHKQLVIGEDGKWSWIEVRNAQGLVRSVREAQPGNRNNMLAWAALTAAEEGVPLDVAMTELTAAALEAGLDERETLVTIRSAYRRRGA